MVVAVADFEQQEMGAVNMHWVGVSLELVGERFICK